MEPSSPEAVAMPEVKLAIIGTGAIASYLAAAIECGKAGAARIVALTDTTQMRSRLEETAAHYRCAWTTDILTLPDYGPDIVIEAASPEVIRQYAIPLLDRGVDLLVMSAGALADGVFLSELEATLRRTNGRLYVPSGAVGGLDVLRAASLGEIDEVRLTTAKPAKGVCGAPWFTQHPMDLNAMTERTVVFSGSVVEAVRWFPQNVNVAAVLHLAALGARSVLVEVAVDPTSNRNVHEIYVRGSFGEMTLRVANVASVDNPKTSQLACLSPLALLRRLSAQMVVGS
jgi:aspartate dehydrogenase